MLLYLAFGTLWTWYVDYASRQYQEIPMNMLERVFNIALWPISVGTFLYHLFFTGEQ